MPPSLTWQPSRWSGWAKGDSQTARQVNNRVSGVSADVIVVGAGIIGAACALYLARSGVSVTVVDRDFPASGTSRACDGLILFSDKLSPAELALAQASAALWAELAQPGALPLDFEYRRAGTLVLYETEAGLDAGRRKVAELAPAGVRAEIVAGAELRKLEPALAPDLAGAVFYEDEAQVDARLATIAMLTEARRLGARFMSGAWVVGLAQDAAGRVTGVRTTEASLPAAAVVCAAGVWSADLVRSLGLELPIRPRKGHILVTAHRPGLLRHPLLEGSYAASVQAAAAAVQVALVAEVTGPGNLLLGSSREFVGYDRIVSGQVVAAIAARAARFLPALAHTDVIRSYAGLRPWTPDHLPLVGPVANVPGLWLASGHEGAGIGLAPVTGQVVAEWLVSGRMPALAEPMRPERFL